MRKSLALIVIALMTFNLAVKSQTILKVETILTFEKAKYLNEDLAKFLRNKTKYPQDAFTNNVQGDVMFSFIIHQNGELDSLLFVSSPNILLSQSTLTALKTMEKKWKPASLNNVPINKKYFIVFRYRAYLNTEPDDFKGRADDLIAKKKYDRALKIYNQAIKDNIFDFTLLESRSKVKELLGDIEGSKQDHNAATKLDDDLMSFVDIVVKGSTQTRVVSSRIVAVPSGSRMP